MEGSPAVGAEAVGAEEDNYKYCIVNGDVVL